MEKKKILIGARWLEIGGAERALLGLLKSIDYEKYDVDLYLCHHAGEFMEYIPNEVNILPEDKNAAAIAIPLKTALKEGRLGIVLGRMLGKTAKQVYYKRHKSGVNNVGVEYSNKFTYPFVKKINPDVTYDVAISFLEPHYIIFHKCKAKKKIAWMHTDYKFMDVDVKSAYKIWSKYDYIVAISQACKEHFLSKFPTLENKILISENVNDVDFIKNQSELFDVENELTGKINLLSIGRYSVAKNFDNVPEICSIIRENRLDVKWYIIGFGGDEEQIRRKIKEYKAENFVILLGKKDNPYPYIKACDAYVQPSRYEGKSVCVTEAQILEKPVIITNYGTSGSQLKDGFDGVIVPLENEKCAKGIVSVLNNKELMKTLSENCKKSDYSNAHNYKKIFDL